MNGLRRLWQWGLGMARDDILVVMYGLMGRGAFRLLSILIVADALGSSDYGLFIFALGIFSVSSWIAELGLDVTAVRYGARHFSAGETSTGQSVFKAVLSLKLVASTAVFIAAVVMAPSVAAYYEDGRLSLLIRIASIGVFGRILLGFSTSYFKALKDFIRNSVVVVLSTLFILLFVLVQLPFAGITTRGALLAFSLGPLFAFLVSLRLIPRTVFTASRGDKKQVLEILGFSRWIYLTNILSSVRLWLPVFILTKIAEESETGFYGLSVQFANILVLLSNAILTSLLPKASEKVTREERRAFLGRAYRKTLPFVTPLFLIVLVSKSAIGFWNRDYLPMVPAFNLVFCGFLFTILAHPIRTVIYSRGKPSIETRIETLMVVLMALLCVLLIPAYGAVGAAGAMFLQRLVSFVFFLSYGCYTYLRSEKQDCRKPPT